MPVGAAIALHAHRAHVGEQHDGALPDLGVEAGGGQLGAHDRVRLAQQLEPVAGDLADDADAEARPRERLAPHDDLGQSQLAADRPHLVFEQGAQRLDELELEVLGQPADVVVALDVGGAGAAAGLDDVRVERALHEELGSGRRRPRPRRRGRPAAASKMRMNSRPMILRLVSGSVTPASASRNWSTASTVTSRTPVAAT